MISTKGLSCSTSLHCIIYHKPSLEPVVLDVSSPADIAKVIYRTMELKRDLDRNLVSIIINNAGDYYYNSS